MIGFKSSLRQLQRQFVFRNLLGFKRILGIKPEFNPTDKLSDPMSFIWSSRNILSSCQRSHTRILFHVLLYSLPTWNGLLSA